MNFKCLLCFYIILGRNLAMKKIFGGREALPGEFPFVVSIQWKTINHQRCGGSILSKIFVLTACHCVQEFDNKSKSLDINNLYITAGVCRKPQNASEIRFPDMAVVHPKCRPAPFANVLLMDLALIRVTHPFSWNKYIQYSRSVYLDRQVLDFETKELIQNNAKCQAVGWGKVIDDYSFVLRTVEVSIIDREECLEILCINIKKCLSVKDFFDVICVESRYSKTNDICQGDSGGPLICNGLVYGVVAWGEQCGPGTKPSIFQSISGWRNLLKLHNQCSKKQTHKLISMLLLYVIIM